MEEPNRASEGVVIEPAQEDTITQPAAEEPKNIPVVSSSAESTAAQPETPVTSVSETVPSTTSPTIKPKKSKKSLMLYGGAVVVNIAIAGATVFFLKAPKPKAQVISLPATTTATVPSEQSKADTTAVETPKSQHYTSEALKLEFDYPSNWRISSNADSTYMTISSAQFDAKQADGGTTKARAEITIYSKYPETTDDVTNSSVISADSDQLTYTSPTKVQRTQTFLSYARAASISNKNAITTAFISSDLGYKLGQLVNSKNYRKTNPFIIFKISACDDLCTQTTGPVAISADTLKSLSQYAIAKDIITSMRFN